jgi:hypothetical protein
VILRTTLLGCLTLTACGSEFDEFARDDRLEHEAVGFVVGLLSREIVSEIRPDAKPLERFLLATIPVVLVAVGKELYDHQHPANHDADPRDAVATIAGGALALSITWRF